MQSFVFLVRLVSALAVATMAPAIAQDAGQPLQIYWIDVEGGSSTLIVSPGGESVLMDAGWNGSDHRDARRIEAAMEDAGVAEIDYFIASHFHGDHVGGLPAIDARVAIHQFIDHGDSVEQDSDRGRAAWELYLSAAQGKRRTIRPGDRLPLAGVDFTFVTADRNMIHSAGGSENPHCGGPAAPEDLGENSRSVGYRVTVGDFEFLDLGDLTVDLQQAAACPTNRFGVVDLLQVPHHAQGVAAELLWALEPTVAVSNNGPTKGGQPEDLAIVTEIPNLESFWQVHRSVGAADGLNAPARMTANLTEEDDQGYWLKATVAANGETYEVTNGRNGFTRSYRAK